MISKVLSIALLVAYTQALSYDHNGATSSVSFNNQHNAFQHIQSAPHLINSVATPVYQAAHVAPSYGYAAPHRNLQSYSSVVPAIKVAAPVYYNAAPTHQASPYSSLNLAHAVSPVHYAAPATPVLLKTAAPIHAGSYSAPSIYNFAPVNYAHAAPAIHQAPVLVKSAHYQQEEYAHPKYEFAYGVEDHHTGDIHSHKETRDGDLTQGEYSLHEADGTVRTVRYSVDKHSGFNAVVERSGHATHAQQSHKTLVAAPVLKSLVGPYHQYYH